MSMTAEERAAELVLRVWGSETPGVVKAIANSIRAAEREALERAVEVADAQVQTALAAMKDPAADREMRDALCLEQNVSREIAASIRALIPADEETTR